MHFPIIKIEPIDLAREDWDIDLGYEDAVLREHTDYYGEIYTEQERKAVIQSDWLRELFDGIATIDTEKETITFLDAGQIRRTMQDYYIDLAKKLLYQAEEGGIDRYDWCVAANLFRGFYTLFYTDYGQTSHGFMDDAHYHAGETWAIGNIFDAHF